MDGGPHGVKVAVAPLVEWVPVVAVDVPIKNRLLVEDLDLVVVVVPRRIRRMMLSNA
jgi:hypothetical protein